MATSRTTSSKNAAAAATKKPAAGKAATSAKKPPVRKAAAAKPAAAKPPAAKPAVKKTAAKASAAAAPVRKAAVPKPRKPLAAKSAGQERHDIKGAQNGHGESAIPKRETRVGDDRSPTLSSPGGRGGETSLREFRSKKSVTHEERYQMIAAAAYWRAERRNFAPGGALDDWIAAEAEIDALLNS